ncbi:MAG: hypothetical protein DIZ80_00105 [endosymbiont of Galathealinum brachiosum]|uniref:Uncharacterized protein n=1 Tax=endosymbiont of Galathealinum brachiosum TaxID=2200906 RepID=A0A370DNG1_9GAMM|nr:MAG: hypothetical protein DIZ80_00105 [endosymbiont of Galathealinum brachiosum]
MSLATHSLNNKTKCEVCDIEVLNFDGFNVRDIKYSVCRSPECQRVMSKKSTLNKYMFQSHLEFNRKIITKQRKRDAARKKRRDDIQARELQELHTIKETVLGANPAISESSVSFLTIPSGGSLTLPVTDERRAGYISHLKSIIEEAGEYNQASELVYDEHHDAQSKHLIVEQRFEVVSGLKEISDRLCGQCKGGCCASGKEHAYLSVFSIRRYMDENPQVSSEELLKMYVDNIAEESIENSCINQTLTGCALSRDLRSDICNGYYCDTLKSFHKKMENKDAIPIVVAIKRASTYWNRFDEAVCNDIVDVTVLHEMYEYKVDW